MANKSIEEFGQNILKPYINGCDEAYAGNIAPVETDATKASKAYSIGDQLILNRVLYDVTANIAKDDALTVGTNIVAADDITTQIKNHTVTTDAVPTKNSTNPVQSGGVYNSEKATREIIAPVEEDATSASQGYAQGAQLILGGVLYDVTATITQGDALTVGTNIVAADDVVTQLSSVKSALTNNVNVNGSKNVLVLAHFGVSGGTSNNQIFTPNKNGSITLSNNGAASQTTIKVIALVRLKAGKQYILSGGISADIRIDLRIYDGTSNGGAFWTDNTESKNCISEGNVSSFIPNNDAEVAVCCRIANGISATGTIYPMICLATDYALDSSYVAPSKTNRQLTEDSVTWDNLSEVGAVNHFNNTLSTQIVNGVTFTVNADKTITASGSVTSGDRAEVSINVTLPSGTYKLSGCPSGGSDDTYRIGGFDVKEYGDGVIITSNGSQRQLYFTVFSGFSSPITFKPMVTDPSYNGPYVPYAKTNKELTDAVADKANLVQYGADWKHTAVFSCDKNSGGLAYLLTPSGILVLDTASSSIRMRKGLALEADTYSYFKAEVSGLTATITVWGESTFETSKNTIWSMIPITGNWTMNLS